MNSIIYDNVVLADDCEYVLYVGQLKTLCYLQFVVEYLQKLEGKKFAPIAIVSDGQAKYPKGNIIALNPLIAKLTKVGHERVSCRISDKALFQAFSQSDRVASLVDELLSRQQSLNTIVFNHTPSFNLGNRQGVRVIGPKAHIAHKWNSKFYQFRALEEIVPIPLSMEVDSPKELQRKLPDFAKLCPMGMFVCTEYGGGGSNSFIAKDANAIYSRLRDFSETVRISKYLAHSYDPTVLAVVANDKDVYIGAIADQNIVDGNKFKGSTHPSTLPAEVLGKLRKYTISVGQQLGKSGYRGIFGCDYIAKTRARSTLWKSMPANRERRWK